jgi:hypothetical protein
MSSNDTGYDKPPSNNHIKAIGTVFALLIAPIIAGIIANVGSFFVQKKLEAPEGPAPAAAQPGGPVVQPVASAGSGPGTPAGPAQSASTSSNPVILQALETLHALPANHLFNGRDLSGFYTYIGPTQADGKAIGKNKDPDQIFTVKNGVLTLSGKEMGALTTIDEYENYLLTVDYKWGAGTYRPRVGLPKIGAIGFHAHGADGSWKGWWMRDAYRARLDEIGAGDLGILPHISTEPHVTIEVEPHHVTTAKNTERINNSYKPGGIAQEVAAGSHTHRLGTVNSIARHTPGATAGPIFEKPPGEWNTMEILCVGDTFGIILNGTLVNAGSKASLTRGKIQFTPDKADLLVRTVDLRSIPRNFPTLPGMAKPSPTATIAKAPEKKPPVAPNVKAPEKKAGSATDSATATKPKVPARGARAAKKKTDGNG